MLYKPFWFIIQNNWRGPRIKGTTTLFTSLGEMQNKFQFSSSDFNHLKYPPICLKFSNVLYYIAYEVTVKK